MFTLCACLTSIYQSVPTGTLRKLLNKLFLQLPPLYKINYTKITRFLSNKYDNNII